MTSLGLPRTTEGKSYKGQVQFDRNDLYVSRYPAKIKAIATGHNPQISTLGRSTDLREGRARRQKKPKPWVMRALLTYRVSVRWHVHMIRTGNYKERVKFSSLSDLVHDLCQFQLFLSFLIQRMLAKEDNACAVTESPCRADIPRRGFPYLPPTHRTPTPSSPPYSFDRPNLWQQIISPLPADSPIIWHREQDRISYN